MAAPGPAQAAAPGAGRAAGARRDFKFLRGKDFTLGLTFIQPYTAQGAWLINIFKCFSSGRVHELIHKSHQFLSGKPIVIIFLIKTV